MPPQDDELQLREQQRQHNIIDAVYESETLNLEEQTEDSAWADQVDYYSSTYSKMEGVDKTVSGVTAYRNAEYIPTDASSKEQKKIVNKMNQHKQQLAKTKSLMTSTRDAVKSAYIGRLDYAHNSKMTAAGRNTERNIYNMRLKVAEQAKVAAYSAIEADVLTKALPENKVPEMKARINLRYQEDRIDAIIRYLKLLPIESSERETIAKLKETEEKKYSALKHELKVILKPEEKKSLWNKTYHAAYDVSKGIMSIINGANPYSHEGAVYVDETTGKKLVNVGRAFMGGTKPMYVFEDQNDIVGIAADGTTLFQQYLYKEAINCMGKETPERALVTEAASQLQQIVSGDNSIPAFVARSSSGKIVGTFQKRVNPYKGGLHKRGADGQPGEEVQKIDLFAWQKDPTDELAPEITKQVLREHVLDWLLCNFDTKGENFLQRAEDGELVSIDKEASFSKLSDKGAQHMSSTYKGNMNDTIYNVIFQLFESGKMTTLDFDSLEDTIERIEAMSDSGFSDMFKPFFLMKLGIKNYDKASHDERKPYLDIERKIQDRKRTLRKEYETFITDMLSKHIAANPNSPMREKLNAQGEYVFRNKVERERIEKEYMEGHSIEDIITDNISAKMSDSRVHDARRQGLADAEKTHDSKMEQLTGEIITDARSHKDGIWDIIGEQYANLQTQSLAIVRQDVEGKERAEHAKRVNEGAELDSKQKKLAGDDVEQVYRNCLKDSLLDTIASYSIPDELKEELDLSYLVVNYIEVIENSYGAKAKYVDDKTKSQYEKVAKDLGAIALIFKGAATATERVLSLKSSIAAWEKATEILRAEYSTNSSSKYYKEMLDKAESMLEAVRKEFSQFMKNDRFVIAPEDSNTGFMSVRNDANRRKVNLNRAELVRISRELQGLDKKTELTEEEKATKVGHYGSIKSLLSDSQDLTRPDLVFGFRIQDAMQFSSRLEAAKQAAEQEMKSQSKSSSEIQRQIAEQAKSKSIMDRQIAELTSVYQEMKGLYDETGKVTSPAKLDALTKQALKIERRIRAEEKLYGYDYEEADELRKLVGQ